MAMNRGEMLASIQPILSLNNSDKAPVIFLPKTENLSQREMANDELSFLGFYVSHHPLDNYRTRLLELTPLNELGGVQLPRVGGVPVELKVIKTKKGQDMAFFSFQDLTGQCEVVIFPNLYPKVKDLIKVGEPIEIVGKVEEVDDFNKEETEDDQKKYKILLYEAFPMEKQKPIKEVHLFLKECDDNAKKVFNVIKECTDQQIVVRIFVDLHLELNKKFYTSYNSLKELERLAHLTKVTE